MWIHSLRHAFYASERLVRAIFGVWMVLGASGCEYVEDRGCTGADCACPSNLPNRCSDGCTNFETDPSHCGECGTSCPDGTLCEGGVCVTNCGEDYQACPKETPEYCAILSRDSNNCGDCGTACPNDQTCIEGQCGCPATRPDFCNTNPSYCTDLDTDSRNCGECHSECKDGRMCREGECVTSCGEDYTTCTGGAQTYCAALDRDPLNCGECGQTCPENQHCARGTCACPDERPMFCDGDSPSCTSLATDPLNCGACDTACADGTVCQEGECVTTCGSGYAFCPNEDTPTYCADLSRDANNCDACGAECPAGQHCVNGACSCPEARPHLCSGDTPFCTDSTTDPLNCGECGERCPDGTMCREGECVTTCGAGYAPCPNSEEPTYCADLSDDTNNCNTCGAACPAGQHCVNGACSCPEARPNLCGDDSPFCTDVTTDPINCGDCDVRCPDGTMCREGECVTTCGAGYAPCPNSEEPTYCADLSDDTNNCNTCGAVCPAGQHCVNGACSCPEARPNLCGDDSPFCTDVTTDPINCGDCDVRCPNGTMCREGECVTTCGAGYAPCPNAEEPTYCADLSVDANNCNTCGSACPAGQHCINGACACPEARPHLCNGETPFCTDFATDPLNCGACDVRCPNGTMCREGECVTTCGAGYAPCPNSEEPTYCADLSDDTNNCNTCGSACPAGQHCVSGACSCPEARPHLCSGDTPFCTDSTTDPLNCGECGERCPDGTMCREGECVTTCGAGYTPCPVGDEPTYCADLSVDADNCNTCGHICPSGQQCVDGQCSCPLARPNLCGDDSPFCTDLTTDPLNCGDCGERCSAGSVCSDGVCKTSCTDGYTACPTDDPTYCADLTRDANNCNACGAECPAGQRCADGQCTCPNARPNLCSGDAPFCANLTTDSLNCGLCGRRCDAGFVCNGEGVCDLSCQEDLVRCNNKCVDVATDRSNCGQCENACPDGFVCDGTGHCKASCQAHLAECDGTCVDTRFDPKNCGECGNECETAEICFDSDCVESGSTVPRCQTTLPIQLNANTPFGTSRPTCELLPDGSGRMTYVLGTGNGPYSTCVFASNAPFESFDADGDAAGVMEIEFCTERPISGQLNVWYGAFPTRKRLTLLRANETLEGGCRTVRRAPEEAVCHWTAHPDWDDDCFVHTGPGYDSTCQRCESQCNNGCNIQFTSTRLELVAEQATLAQNTPAVVTLKSVRFLPEDCACTNDGQCEKAPGRTDCATGLFSSRVCPAGASVCGVCVPAAETCTAPMLACGGECIDPSSDENHCGECDTSCVLEGGVSVCVDGECRLVDCEPGFGDADGDEANGCECSITNGGIETCDNRDNDCDGLTDWALKPDPHSVCECFDRKLPVDRHEEEGERGCRAPGCTTLPGGGIEMTYCFNECDQTGPYARCLFAGPVDLSDYDANFGRDGLLEVVFQVVDNAVAGKLHLNYGNHPNRKYVELISRGESLPPGIYRQYYAPDQVRFSSASPHCPETCGPCPDVPGDPNFRFAAVDMTLVAEGCASSVNARVRLLSVNVVARGCGCLSSSDCADTPERSVCYAPDSGAGQCGWPGELAPGVCGSASCDTDVPLGTACTISIQSSTCSGTWQCRNGVTMCEVVSCP